MEENVVDQEVEIGRVMLNITLVGNVTKIIAQHAFMSLKRINPYQEYLINSRL